MRTSAIENARAHRGTCARSQRVEGRGVLKTCPAIALMSDETIRYGFALLNNA
jgi:hypothetical protein